MRAVLVVLLALAPEVPLLIPTDGLGALEAPLIVDTRSAEAYSDGHIPGAVHVDPGALAETREGVVGLLRPVPDVVEALRQAGVSPERHVVIYAGMATPGEMKDATRLFWILEYLGFSRVSVLDGGYAKWTAENRPVEAGQLKPKPAEPWTPEIREERLATLDEVKAAGGQAHLVDLRSEAQFSGSSKDSKVSAAGHIPGAVNAPDTEFVDAAMCTVKPAESIDERLKMDGIDGSRPVITYCNSGRAASVGYFMMRLRGLPDVALYDGSMAEWTHEGQPVERTEAAAAAE